MAYVKHASLGNRHVADSEADKLQAEGWVKWPRTKEQKAGAAPVVKQTLTTDEFIAEVVAVEKRKPGRPRKG
jgi:hypothetical protein